ncbi:MAG: FtsX-like permease family protein [Gemmatimonadetes bacterium]|nr:FtsX-like permease family protein [Gemmatimonadota bacterium]
MQPDPYQLSNFHVAMAASAIVVLLIACANLANLMNARGVTRRRELALRLAIGARRGALVRQLLVEAGLLAVIGGALGVVAALWGVNLVKAAMPQVEYFAMRPPLVSWRFFVFGIAASGCTVLLFGLLPAIRASDVDLAEPLKEGAGAHTGHVRRYSLLAIVQVALALVLVMSAAVSAKSAYQLANAAFGFDPKGLYQAIIGLPRPQYTDAKGIQAAYDHALAMVARLPGVKSVATVGHGRSAGGVVTSDFEGDSLPIITLLSYPVVSPSFLSMLGLPVIAGRDFAPGDRETGGAVLVNESAARRLWRGQHPVGRMIKLGSLQSTAPWIRVVGVVANSRFEEERERYLPQPAQVWVVPSVDSIRTKWVLFRAALADSATPVLVARELRAAIGGTRTPRVGRWLEWHEYRAGVAMYATRIFVFLGICALGLATVGLYGVLAYAVTRRVREYGVRMALGATREHVFRMVLHDGTVMYLAGTAFGALAALGILKVLDSMLYDVPLPDVVSLIVSEAVLCGAAFLACLVPARRAMRADPVEILRST